MEAIRVARHATTRGLAALGAAISSDLGKWFLTTAMVGFVVNGITQRNECLQTRDHDLLVDTQDSYEANFALSRFLLLASSAKTPADIKVATAEIEGRDRDSLLSVNRGRTLFDMFLEHGIATNRWGGDAPKYFTDDVGGNALEFAVLTIEETQTHNITEAGVSGIASEARKLLNQFDHRTVSDQGTLWNEDAWTVNCGFFEVLFGKFRRTDAQNH